MFLVKIFSKGDKMHNINLSNFNLRTDLILETLENNHSNINKNIKNYDEVIVTTIDIDKSLEKQIHKKQGTYITLEFEDITNFETREKIGNILEQKLKIY